MVRTSRSRPGSRLCAQRPRGMPYLDRKAQPVTAWGSPRHPCPPTGQLGRRGNLGPMASGMENLGCQGGAGSSTARGPGQNVQFHERPGQGLGCRTAGSLERLGAVRPHLSLSGDRQSAVPTPQRSRQ